jgi:16S rRNA (guanine527-N7)-methyltransferase
LETEQELLRKGLQELDITASTDSIDRFIRYLLELQKWNRAYNLTALKNARDIIIKHFFDSLLFLKAFPNGGGVICDIGSGAGFPGVPIGLVRPDISITLVEPSRKKCAFLRNVKRVLALDNVEIVESRVEDVRDSEFDTAVTRALFTISDFVKKTRHIVKQNGCLIMSKGPRYREEVEKIPPGIRLEHIAVILPLTSLERHLIRILADY